MLWEYRYANCGHKNFKKIKLIKEHDLLTNEIDKYEVYKCIRCGYEIKLKEGMNL